MKEMNYFDAIAGYHSEKKMMEDLANLIKNKDELNKMGGRLPKGLLLMGENGLGKTVLAQAFIKTAGCYTVSVDCSSIDSEKFKELISAKFKEASMHTPAIVFIDELDKIAGSSNAFDTGNNFSHFKDLLFTMNEYLKTKDLFILACANPSFDIERSIIRSGRIDRVIRLQAPTQSERVEIFQHFAKDKKIATDVDFQCISKMTLEFTGADIEVIMNEATIAAFNDKRDEIHSYDIEKAISDKRFGPLEKESEYRGTNLRIIAAHEAGHAVVAMALTGKVLNRLTVARRGEVAGYAETLFDEEQVVSLKDKFDKAVVCLAGREAEKIFYNTAFAGAYSDVFHAHHIITTLVTAEGAYGTENLLLTPKERMFWPNQLINRVPSEERKKRIETLEDNLMNSAAQQAHSIIMDNIELANTLIDRLVLEKTLTKDDLDQIYEDYFHKKAVGTEDFANRYVYNPQGYSNQVFANKNEQ